MFSERFVLHGFFRSSASWRVRIALNLKGIPFDQVTYRLRAKDQLKPEYLMLNPQGLVPSLDLAGAGILRQSLAICEYLNEQFPDPPLLPTDPMDRAHTRALSQIIACDIHPLQNLKILERLGAFGCNDDQVNEWARKTIDEGLEAIDLLLSRRESSSFAMADFPTLADICLVPQMYNARRFGVDLRWQRLLDIESACLALREFSEARPDCQPDAV